MSELEALTGNEEVFRKMVMCIKELTEDEEIRQRRDAREDYKRRLKGAYIRGIEEGEINGLKHGIEQGIKQGIRQEKANTEAERIRADVAEEEARRLRSLLESHGIIVQ